MLKTTDAETNFITEPEFARLCDELYADRQQIYEFNPNASKRDALLWMLTGCLISLLSVPVEEQSKLDDPSSSDPYADAISRLLENRMRPRFDPRAHLARMSEKLAKEDEL
ncbi:MAG TPA: hypothetical protein VGC64_06290 [Pyrinomonadaceae bacterium]|jgi:hypothetical protein